MNTVLITGSNRGIGLEFCRQYLQDGWRVYATCRLPDAATELQSLARESANISLHQLDLRDWSAIDRLAVELADIKLDILLNNAGIFTDQQRPFGDFDFTAWETSFRVNTIAPVKMAEAFFAPLIRGDEKKLVNISSTMGSISQGGGGACSYRASKAALNAAMNCLSREFTQQGIQLYLFHPGWVATDMGTSAATLSPAQSAKEMRRVIATVTPKPGRTFINHLGQELPW